MDRLERLESAVRAGMALRKALIDDSPEFKALTVMRKDVVKYDEHIEYLKGEALRETEPMPVANKPKKERRNER